jgi:hypothetical protein
MSAQDDSKKPIGGVDEGTRQRRIEAHIEMLKKCDTACFASTEYKDRNTLRWNTGKDMQVFVGACSIAILTRAIQIGKLKGPDGPLEHARVSLKAASTKLSGGVAKWTAI